MYLSMKFINVIEILFYIIILCTKCNYILYNYIYIYVIVVCTILLVSSNDFTIWKRNHNKETFIITACVVVFVCRQQALNFAFQNF